MEQTKKALQIQKSVFQKLQCPCVGSCVVLLTFRNSGQKTAAFFTQRLRISLKQHPACAPTHACYMLQHRVHLNACDIWINQCRSILPELATVILDKHKRIEISFPSKRMSAETSSIQVVVRLRPMNEKEKKHSTLPVIKASTSDKTVTVIKGNGMRQARNTFAFDNVFTAFSTQEDVFGATLKPVIRYVLFWCALWTCLSWDHSNSYLPYASLIAGM